MYHVITFMTFEGYFLSMEEQLRVKTIRDKDVVN